MSSKIRELLAKIQRDFHFPKVYAIRCSIPTGVNEKIEPAKVNIKSLPSPEATCRELQTQFQVQLQPGHIHDPQCHTSQPLEEAAANVESIDCFHDEHIEIREPEVVSHAPKVVPFPNLELGLVASQPDFLLANPVIRGGLFPFSVRVGTNTRKIHLQGIRFPMRLMKNMPMRQVIRYRAQSLRKLMKKVQEIDFIGVCPIIPPAALRFVELSSEQDIHFATGVLKGIPDYMAHARAWVIYRDKKDQDIKAVTVKKEQ